jgi:hypothetical protein
MRMRDTMGSLPIDGDARPAHFSIVGTVAAGYRGVRRLIREAPLLVLLMLVVEFCDAMIASRFTTDTIANRTAVLGLHAVAALLVAPLEFLALRLLLRNAKPQLGLLTISSPRLQRFVVWTMAIWFLSGWLYLLPTNGDVQEPADLGLLLTFFIGFLVAVITLVRLATWFPALAVGPEDVRIKTSFQSTRRCFWPIASSFILGLLPVLLMIIVGWFALDAFDLIGDDVELSGWESLPQFALISIASVLASVLALSISAEIYRLIDGAAPPLDTNAN